MAAPSKCPGWISLRALSLRYGLNHGFFSVALRTGKMVGVESRRLGNRVLLKQDEVLDMVVKDLLSRGGKPLRLMQHPDSSKQRRRYLQAVATGERDADRLDREVARGVMLIAAKAHEERMPGQRLKLSIAALEAARSALALKRADDAQMPEKLRAVASAIRPLS
jgi:hypothetical protein